MKKLLIALLALVLLLAACTTQVQVQETTTAQTTATEATTQSEETTTTEPNPPWHYLLNLPFDEFRAEHGCGITDVELVECEETGQLLLVLHFCANSWINYAIKVVDAERMREIQFELYPLEVLNKPYLFEVSIDIRALGGILSHAPREVHQLAPQVFMQWTFTSPHTISLFVGSDLPLRVEEREFPSRTTTSLRHVIPIWIGESP